MQEQKKALETENETLRQRIEQLEVDQEEHYQNKSMKGQALMNNYVEGQSYLSSEIM